MSYRTPDSRTPAVRALLEALDQAGRIVLTTHVNADGDGTGCEVALASWLAARGKEAWIVNPTPFPETFRFLPDASVRILSAADPEAAGVAASADFALVVDTGEVRRIGRVKPLIDPLPRAVIDHHPEGDDPIPGLSFRDPGACAAGELVYDVVLAAGGPWTDAVVRGLYVAVLTDTGSFRHGNTTAASFRLAADLVERGADPEGIHRAVYGAVPVSRLHLLRRSLETLEVDERGSVAWITVPEEAFQQLGGDAEDLEGIVDYPRSIAGVEVGLLFRTLGDGATKVSFRSNGRVDVNRVARRFGGGGHVMASGAVVGRPLDEVRAEVVAAAQDAVGEAVPAGSPQERNGR